MGKSQNADIVLLQAAEEMAVYPLRYLDVSISGLTQAKNSLKRAGSDFSTQWGRRIDDLLSAMQDISMEVGVIAEEIKREAQSLAKKASADE